MPTKRIGFGSRAPLLPAAALLFVCLIPYPLVCGVPAAGYPVTQGILVEANLSLS